MIYTHAGVIVAAILALTPLLLFGFEGERCVAALGRQPLALRLLLPAVCVVPYLLVCWPLHLLRAGWLALYLVLPIAVAALLAIAAKLDPQKRGHALDFLVLLALGLAVDLRQFEPAWPHALVAMNKVLLLDTGIYGFHVIRKLDDVGFDLRWRLKDWKTGLRELLFYMPIAVMLCLAIGFLHWHGHINRPWLLPGIWLFTYLLIALPEEILLRRWIQNLFERRLGRTASLVVTAGLLRFSHVNKRAAHFNWRYVLLAAIAGIFYGRGALTKNRSLIHHPCLRGYLWGALLQ